MKKIGLLWMLLLLVVPNFAQNNAGKADDAARIVLKSWVPPQIEGMPAPARKNLENKLSQIVTKSGLGGKSIDGRFIITANVTVLTKDVTPTTPPMQAYTLEVTLYIGDGIDGTEFANTSTTLKGVGEDEKKAYMAALKNLKVNDPSYQAFIEQGKNRILEYYNSQIDFLIKKAETLADQNQYDAAIATLVAVPEVCKEAYEKAMAAVQPIYQKKINQEGAALLAEARNVWSAGQDVAAAESASAILSKINPQSTSFAAADKLSADIAKRVKELDQREWDFMLKQQQDEVDLEKASIQAIRDIGVAYGENQQPTTYNVVWW